MRSHTSHAWHLSRRRWGALLVGLAAQLGWGRVVAAPVAVVKPDVSAVTEHVPHLVVGVGARSAALALRLAQTGHVVSVLDEGGTADAAVPAPLTEAEGTGLVHLQRGMHVLGVRRAADGRYELRVRSRASAAPQAVKTISCDHLFFDGAPVRA